MTAMPETMRPDDAAMLRRLLVEHYGSPQGYGEYLMAIFAGTQQVMPPGPPPAAARWLTDHERQALTLGDVWLIDDPLCGMLDDAHGSLPPFYPRPHDLPAEHGFVVFARPLDTVPVSPGRIRALSDRMFGPTDDPTVNNNIDQIERSPTRIVAASWRPFLTPNWPSGGVWFSFYGRRAPLPTDHLAAPIMGSPPINVDNECIVAWAPEHDPPKRYLLGPRGDTGEWARGVFAAFMLARQQSLTETDTVRPARAERRRQQRAGIPERDIRVMRLRSRVARARAADAGGRRYDRVRWPVREHWRDQWYPSIGEHRPKLIAAYLKGPADAPLIGGDRVTIVTAPKPQ